MKKITISGKDYVPVHERLMEFWKNNPAWSIRTEILNSSEGKVRIKASIYDHSGVLRVTGHGEERENSTFINKTSYVENCETSAIGRALGLLGIGIDTSLASFEEVVNAMVQKNDTIVKKDDSIVQKEDFIDRTPFNFDDSREWISEAQFQKTIERFKSGEKDVIDKALNTFRMKRELRLKLLEMKGGNHE
jgi:hypothetical protein